MLVGMIHSLNNAIVMTTAFKVAFRRPFQDTSKLLEAFGTHLWLEAYLGQCIPLSSLETRYRQPPTSGPKPPRHPTATGPFGGHCGTKVHQHFWAILGSSEDHLDDLETILPEHQCPQGQEGLQRISTKPDLGHESICSNKTYRKALVEMEVGIS